MSKCDTPDCDKEANWYGSKSLCTPCLHKAAVDAPRLREQINRILLIAETNMALQWGDTDASFEWGYIIDMIKGWTE